MLDKQSLVHLLKKQNDIDGTVIQMTEAVLESNADTDKNKVMQLKELFEARNEIEVN